jgi:2,4-dienoyl-CoA reductase-like NADH-dependent reductase (Old Yellow Enzyme family)
MSLFTPLTLKAITFKNRIAVSPMCQYSSIDGLAAEWHMVHLGSRAVGGAALVIVEATAVTPEGRITPDDMGLWSEAHQEAFRPITRFIESQASVPGIQLAHAGRKASTFSPWKGEGALKTGNGAWETLSASALPFQADWHTPRAMTGEDLRRTAEDFAKAAKRAFLAGFEFLEVHSAHGYLLHQFLSPLSNQRKDEYGGGLSNRMRFPLEVVGAVRKAWPENLPLAVRISATDWAEGGWDLEQSVEYAKKLKALGVDLVDCSSGGLVPNAKVQVGPGYQVPFSERIRKETGVHTMAVGMITEPAQAEAVIEEGKADMVALARAFLRDPYWALHAAHTLGVDAHWPAQYGRAKPVKKTS